VSGVQKFQVTKFLTLSPDIVSITMEFFLTNSYMISSHAPSKKHQITGSQFSPELQVLSIGPVSYHHSSA